MGSGEWSGERGVVLCAVRRMLCLVSRVWCVCVGCVVCVVGVVWVVWCVCDVVRRAVT